MAADGLSVHLMDRTGFNRTVPGLLPWGSTHTNADGLRVGSFGSIPQDHPMGTNHPRGLGLNGAESRMSGRAAAQATYRRATSGNLPPGIQLPAVVLQPGEESAARTIPAGIAMSTGRLDTDHGITQTPRVPAAHINWRKTLTPRQTRQLHRVERSNDTAQKRVQELQEALSQHDTRTQIDSRFAPHRRFQARASERFLHFNLIYR
jgi:hypothetical protein